MDTLSHEMTLSWEQLRTVSQATEVMMRAQIGQFTSAVEFIDG